VVCGEACITFLVSDPCISWTITPEPLGITKFCEDSSLILSLALCWLFHFGVGRFKMSERKEDMGAVAHQLSNTGDDMQKTGNVKEANVASVALGKLTTQTFYCCSFSVLTCYSCCPRGAKAQVAFEKHDPALRYHGDRLLSVDTERFRFVPHGCHQCHGVLPEYFQPNWRGFVDWYHFHHLQLGSDCSLPLVSWTIAESTGLLKY
jgi:hypothetical protein